MRILRRNYAGIAAPTVILTHRSRAEAKRILQAADLPGTAVAGVVAAEDLFLAAIRGPFWFSAVRRGLRKSLILPTIEQRFQTPRARMAMIDDGIGNLRDLTTCGLGLALHAPSALGPGGTTLVSFNFDEAARVLKSWTGKEQGKAIRSLAPREASVRPFQRTGITTTREAHHAFNLLRRLWRGIRLRVAG